MDPQETWHRLLDAWVNRQWDEVHELSEALLAWLDHGGFPPEIQYPREMGAEFNRSIARAACEYVGNRAATVLEDPFGIPRDITLSIACNRCKATGPATDAEARELGWQDITYFPNATFENLLGLCPNCSASRGGPADL